MVLDNEALIVEIDDDGEGQARFRWRKLLQFLGPGFLMCIAYVVRFGVELIQSCFYAMIV